MTLEIDGFLSPAIEARAAEAMREYCPAHVALVERVNRFAVAVAGVPRDLQRRDADLFAAMLLGRAIQDFEGAVILAARGLRAQSRSLVRSTFETALYCMAASRDLVLSQGARLKAKKDEAPTITIVAAIEAGHQRFRAQMAAELQKIPETPAEHAAALGLLLEDIGSPGQLQDVDVKGLAEDLGQLALYTTIYRPFSQDAHPSATSLEHHLVLTPERKIAGLHIGPDYHQFDDTLTLAICSLLVALDGFLERFGAPDERQQLQHLATAYRELNEGVNASRSPSSSRSSHESGR
jgi:hypothetical protein